MAQTFDILLDQTAITQLELVTREALPLAPGQARLKLQSFALTANNVTYAATGFQIGYWKFFPTDRDGKGKVPVWGHAVVTESSSPHLQTGQRVYGFYPMAEELVIEPRPSGGKAVLDASAHRAELPAIYNLYVVTQKPPSSEDYYQALLQPLIATSYLLWDWLLDNDWFGAQQIIIGSASSKTGLGLCKFLSEQTDRPYRVVGLTSSSNTSFVSGLGYCDAVKSYEEIEEIDKIRSVYVDMAGNGVVKTNLHAHLAENLMHSSAVGLSHWDKFEQLPNLAGPKPQFFFAPAQIAKRKVDWGPGVIEKKISEASRRVAEQAPKWMNLRAHTGLAAAIPVFQDIASGRSKPNEGHVVVLAES